MPEKAFKMQGWVIVGGYMERHYRDSPMSKWLVGGAAAGALTALIGENNIISTCTANCQWKTVHVLQSFAVYE